MTWNLGKFRALPLYRPWDLKTFQAPPLYKPWDLEKFQVSSSFEYSQLAKHRAKRCARCHSSNYLLHIGRLTTVGFRSASVTSQWAFDL